jgi:hypothetical protein
LSASIEFAALSLFDNGKIGFADPCGPHGTRVSDPNATFADRPDCIFGVSGRTQFSDQDHVERRRKRVGDYRSNRYSAARNAENDRVSSPQVLKMSSQPHAGIRSVGKQQQIPFVIQR